MKTKLISRYLTPSITMVIGILISSFFRVDGDYEIAIRYSRLIMAIYSVVYMVVISVLQFFISNNLYLVPITMFIVVNLLYAQFKIQHYPGQMAILIIGYAISGVVLLIGILWNRNRSLEKDIKT